MYPGWRVGQFYGLGLRRNRFSLGNLFFRRLVTKRDRWIRTLLPCSEQCPALLVHSSSLRYEPPDIRVWTPIRVIQAIDASSQTWWSKSSLTWIIISDHRVDDPSHQSRS